MSRDRAGRGTPILKGALLQLPLAAAGFLLVLLATSRYGAGLSPDSAAYVSTARHLAAGKGYTLYSGEPYVDWGPLFPTVLAACGRLGLDPIPAARWVNAAVFGLILGVAGGWLRR